MRSEQNTWIAKSTARPRVRADSTATGTDIGTDTFQDFETATLGTGNDTVNVQDNPSQFLTNIDMRLLAWMGRKRGRLSSVPLAKGWTKYRELPAPQGRTFQARWRAGERPGAGTGA